MNFLSYLGQPQRKFCHPFDALAKPFWTGGFSRKNESVGQFRADLEAEFLIWRPVMARKISLAEVKNGTADLVDLMKINAILDMQDEAQAREAAKWN